MNLNKSTMVTPYPMWFLRGGKPRRHNQGTIRLCVMPSMRPSSLQGLGEFCVHFFPWGFGRIYTQISNIHPPKFDMVHLKINPWKFGDSFWKSSFSGSMLNFGGVDAKNDGYLIVSPFKYGYLCYFGYPC